MTTSKLRSRCILFICLWLNILAVSAQTNRALIVNISHYPDGNGWESIHADNDACLTHALLAACGYQETDITTLTDAQASKRGIIHALQNICNATQAGDHVHLHFSCHGQQMMDDNGDEEDGLDEALIPYDARFGYMPGEYEGAHPQRDDELGEWIRSLRRKAGEQGHVTVVLDACHSGTGNRLPEADDYVRGTGYIFAPDDYEPTAGKHQELSLHLKQEAGLAPTVGCSACLADEINFEYFDTLQSRYSGLLTYAFCETARETKNTVLTAGRFTELLKQKMQALTANKKKRKQTPYMECTSPQESFRIALKP